MLLPVLPVPGTLPTAELPHSPIEVGERPDNVPDRLACTSLGTVNRVLRVRSHSFYSANPP
jgi:hypothetical protein